MAVSSFDASSNFTWSHACHSLTTTACRYMAITAKPMSTRCITKSQYLINRMSVSPRTGVRLSACPGSRRVPSILLCLTKHALCPFKFRWIVTQIFDTLSFVSPRSQHRLLTTQIRVKVKHSKSLLLVEFDNTMQFYISWLDVSLFLTTLPKTIEPEIKHSPKHHD